MRVPRTTRPRSAGGLSPRHTASPSSEMPSGGGLTPKANALVFAEVGGDATLSLDGLRYSVQGRPGALRDRNDVEVVEEGQ